MLTWTKFKAADILDIDLQAQQQINKSELPMGQLENTDARTYRNELGEVIFIGGLVEKWQNSAIIWALLAKNSGKYLVQITREVKAWIASYDYYRRIEFFVSEGFEQAKRWAGMLGFKLDGMCPCFFANGANGLIYSRIKNG